MSGEYIVDMPIEEYLADRTRSSGSSLRMEPEDYARWLLGHDVGGSSEAQGRGSWFHARLTEGPEARDRFAFVLNRNEATEPEWERTEAGAPRKLKGQKVPLMKDGEQVMLPQDASDAGAKLTMLRVSAHAKKVYRRFCQANEGKTLVTPEAQGVVEPMLRAALHHPEVKRLLEHPGFRPEVTGHFTCPVTGERLRYRPDGLTLCPDEPFDIGLEVKTIAPKHGRLDTLDTRSVMSWARSGWALKSEIAHAGHFAITGRNLMLFWVVVEATDRDPRVSVVPDPPDSTMARVGREGVPSWGVLGYQAQARRCQEMRKTGVFQHPCTLGLTPGFPFPDFIEEGDAQEGDVVIGAEPYNG